MEHNACRNCEHLKRRGVGREGSVMRGERAQEGESNIK
jgi:hypothetical protein